MKLIPSVMLAHNNAIVYFTGMVVKIKPFYQITDNLFFVLHIVDMWKGSKMASEHAYKAESIE